MTENGGPTQQQQQRQQSAAMNSFRISAVADRLANQIQSGLGVGNGTEFFNLCLALARGIDYAVANNEPPSLHAKEQLPSLLKQICQQRQNCVQHTAIMVLMVSVKNACSSGWFSTHDSEQLLALAQEIAAIFCSSSDVNTSVNFSIISKIMARYYPLMNMGKILASLEVKRGYGTHIMDFQISKPTAHDKNEKIRLFVAQTDSIETSACIISPQQVNFLLNGKGVDRRTNVFPDNGPQMPTNVSSLLKYGTNLLQAVGQFDGDCIILIAFMSVKSPTPPTIPDYVQHDVASQDLDSDIIEGPSRISLNCPISYTRIRTPVKGHSCKHLQCFDFDNFVDINLRRPSWRCPHCSRPVCYTDIRLDQNMVKVLREVGNRVADIIISADGSWKAVMETDDPTDEARATEVVESPNNNNSLFLDLTGEDNIMNEMIWSGTEDRKPIIDEFSMPSVSNNNEVIVSTSDVPPIDDDFWSGISFPGESVGTGANMVSSSASTVILAPALSQGAEHFGQNQFSGANVQMQRMVRPNQATNHEYRLPTGRFQEVIRNASAIQALPVPSSQQPPQERAIVSSSPVIPNGSSSPRPSFSPVLLNPVTSQQHHPTVQGHLRLAIGNNWFAMALFCQPNIALVVRRFLLRMMVDAILLSACINRSHPYSQVPGAHSQNLRQQQQRTMATSPVMMTPRPSTTPRLPLMRTPMAANGQSGNGQPSRFTYVPRQPMPGQTPRTTGQQSYPVSCSGADMTRMSAAGEQQRVNVRGPVTDLASSLPGDQSWQPAGRMRGSLSGRHYSAALNELIIQPTQSSQQPTQPVKPPPASASVASQSIATTVPSLEALLTNTRATNPNPNPQS
ncbi:hypothetical protein ACFE04_024966 [Oxalis oulophora]